MRANASDSGTYRCEAANQFGSSTSSINISVQGMCDIDLGTYYALQNTYTLLEIGPVLHISNCSVKIPLRYLVDLIWQLNIKVK